jgi:hypothetical protein
VRLCYDAREALLKRMITRRRSARPPLRVAAYSFQGRMAARSPGKTPVEAILRSALALLGPMRHSSR